MVDKSFVPCKHCGHSHNEHSRHFDRCFKCEEYHKYAGCKFERLDNLLFLEWVVKQKGE
jgi:hypothetical protein